MKNGVYLHTLVLMLVCSGCCLQQPPSHLGTCAHSLLFPFSLPCLAILAHSRCSSHPCPPREESNGLLVTVLCSSRKCDPTLTGTRQTKDHTTQDLWLRIPAQIQAKARASPPGGLRAEWGGALEYILQFIVLQHLGSSTLWLLFLGKQNTRL